MCDYVQIRHLTLYKVQIVILNVLLIKVTGANSNTEYEILLKYKLELKRENHTSAIYFGKINVHDLHPVFCK